MGEQQDANNQQQDGQSPAGQSETPPETWDAWLATQPEAERTRIEALHAAKTAPLKSALDKERDERKGLEKQLRDAAKNAEKGSALETQLTATADRLALAERRADFFQQVAKPEIGLVDAEAAWVLANADADAYFDKRGNVNLALLKERHPALFTQLKPAPRGNAGTGTDQGGAGKASMNDFIRRAAGRT